MTVPGNLSSPLLATAADGAAAAVDITKSLRFASGDSPFLNRTPSSVGNRRTFTWAGWVKNTIDGTFRALIEGYAGSEAASVRTSFQLNNVNKLHILFDNTNSGDLLTTAVFRDTAWYHIVLAVDTTQATASDRVKIYVNGSQITDFDNENYPAQNYQTGINNNQPHYINRVADPLYGSWYASDIYLIDGSALDPTSFGSFDSNGVWQAAGYSGTFGTNGFHLKFDDTSSNSALGTDSSGNSNNFTVNNLVAAQFSSTATVVGDPTSSTDNPFGSGQGHSVDFDGNDSIRFSGPGLITGDVTIECFLKIDSGQSGFQRAFSTNEAVYSSEQTMIRRHSNGSFQFYFGDGTAEETDDSVDGNTWHHAAISYDQSASAVSYYVDGTRVGTDTYSGTVKITEMVVAGGMTNENFNGKVSNCRITKQLLYTGTSLTVPTSTLTTTSQGATASNVVLLCCHKSSTTAVEGAFTAASETDCLFDVPLNDTTNTDSGAGGEVSGCYAVWNPLGGPSSTYGTFSQGNLKASLPASGKALAQTIFPQSGKWYCEIDFVSGGGAGGGLRIGVINEKNIGIDLGSTANSWAYLADGRVYHNASAPSYGVSSSPGDKLMMALDIDAGKLWYGKNGTWMASGDPANGSNPSQSFTAGQKMSFSAQSGSGTVQVVDANWGQRAWEYTAPSGFKAVCTSNLTTPTITDGSTAFEAVSWTGTGASKSLTTSFSPDFIWLKNRSISSNHRLFDTIRGIGGMLHTNTRDNEQSDTNNLTSFDTNGFTVGTNSNTNGSGNAIIAWTWDAGSSTDTNNTSGSITPAGVRASTTNGFSIVKYVGTGANATCGHGLSAAPDWIIFKDINRDNEPWLVYHSALGSSAYLFLNTTAAQTTGQSDFMNSTDPTSSVFSLGNATGKQNRNGSNFLALCWTAVAGFSSFGTYEGTGNSDGPFIDCGFKPKLVIYKNADDAAGWQIYDSARDPFNQCDARLQANSSGAEDTEAAIDILSNGFKQRATHTRSNASGDTYIYAAFAEVPISLNGGLAR